MERDDYEYGDPCPECGHTGHFHETAAAHGVSHFDDDGTVTEFDEEMVDYPLYIECPECNEVLMDKLPEPETKTVNVGFSAPGSVWVDVEDPEDVNEVTEAFIKKMEQLDEMSLLDMIETDPEWLAENMMYVDGENGEVYQEW